MRKPRYSHEAYPIDRPDRKWSRWQCTPGIASEFIHHLPDLLAEGRKPVLLYCRASSPEQEQDGNLNDQVNDAIQQLQAMGIKRGHGLVGVVRGVESSRVQDDRPLLKQVIEDAWIRGAIVVAVSRDRLIRSRSFDGSNKTEAPTIAEYMQLHRMVGDVLLATIRHPDSPAARSDSIKRGQKAKGRKGGRPRKRNWKERRLARIDPAREMRDEGKSYQQIADSLNARDDGFYNVTKKTVWNWLQRCV